MAKNKYHANKTDEYDSDLERNIVKWAEEVGVTLVKNTTHFTYLESFEAKHCCMVVPQRTTSKKTHKKYDRPSVKSVTKVGKRVYTPDFVYTLPGGLDLYIEAKGKELSDWTIRRDMFARHMEDTQHDCVFAVVKSKQNLLDLFKLLKIIDEDT